MTTHTDPACGMQVDEQSAAGRSEYQEETYYFCSQGCKNKFDQDPERFVGKSGANQA